MDYDDILHLVNPFGKYQKLVIFFVLQPALFPCAFLGYNSVFLAATPADYWCRLPESLNVTTPAERANLLPVENHHGGPRTSHCAMFDYNYSTLALSPYWNVSTINLSNYSLPEIACQSGWDFDRSVYEKTIVTEYALVCDQHLAATWSFALTSFGGVVGTLGWGFLADRWGRKPTFFALILFQSIFSLASGFSPNFIFYCCCRFLAGTTVVFCYSLPYLLSIELTGTDNRVTVSVICSAGYTLSVVIIVGLAYAIRTWRMLNFVSAVPLACLLCLWGVFPESPRWLLTQGRYKEVEAFIRKLSRINRRPLPKEIDQNLSRILEQINLENSNSNEKHSMIDLLRTPNMRKKTLILAFINFCNLGVFVGLNYYAPSFGEDPHLNTMLSGLIEFPPYLFASFVCNRFGRRASLVVAMALGAVSCMVAAGVPNSADAAIMAMSLVTKFFVTLTFMIGELLEEEIFPTVVRGEGSSLTIIMSSMAGCAAPFIVHLGHSLLVLPLAIFGALCVVAAVCALFLPETVGTDLPQTLTEGEKMGKDMPWKEILSLRIPERNRISQRQQRALSKERVESSKDRKKQNAETRETNMLLKEVRTPFFLSPVSDPSTERLN